MNSNFNTYNTHGFSPLYICFLWAFSFLLIFVSFALSNLLKTVQTAFQELQEMMTDIERQIDAWQQKYETLMVDAGLEDEGVEIEDARLTISDIRNLANQLR